MKNVFNLLAIAVVFSFAACGAADKAKEMANDAAEATTDAVASAGDAVASAGDAMASAASDALAKLVGDKYSVDTEASSISWTGSKKIGDSHSGTFALANGTVAVDKGSITGGVFTIDINSIKNTDMAGSDGAGKLEGHLKAPDFFDAVKFPTATFLITKVTKVMNNDSMTHTVSGDMTLLGVTNNISMPATVSIEGDKLMASVKDYALNRADFGMKYGSGLMGAAADKIINDNVMISLELVASK